MTPPHIGWSAGITLLTIAASGIAGWTTLNDSRQTTILIDADQEHRLRTLELDRSRLEELHKLSIQVAELNVLLQSLRQDMRDSRAVANARVRVPD